MPGEFDHLVKRDRENARLEIEIQAAHQRTRETYSAKRLHSALVDHGVQTTPVPSMDTK